MCKRDCVDPWGERKEIKLDYKGEGPKALALSNKERGTYALTLDPVKAGAG